jgi:hypothetical protein
VTSQAGMSLLLPSGLLGATIGAFVGALFLSSVFARLFRRVFKLRRTLALLVGSAITPPCIFLYSWLVTDKLVLSLRDTIGSFRSPRSGYGETGPVPVLVGTLLPAIGDGRPIVYFAAYLGAIAVMLGPRYSRARQRDADAGNRAADD